MAHYIYVPGLAREDCVKSKEKFDEKIADFFSGDPFIESAVKALQKKGAKGIDCGKELKWLDTSKVPKAFKKMGAVSDNILSRKVGQQPQAPRKLGILEHPHMESIWCHVKEMLAQPMPLNIKGKKALQTLGAKDMLNIVGHGNPRGGSLGFRTYTVETCSKKNCTASHRVFWSVDPVTLASLLIDEGLPKGHKSIQMVQCFGAGLSEEEYQTVQPYAERLARTLRDQGYKSINVGGAVGIVWGPDLKVSPKFKPEFAPGGDRLLVEIGNKQSFEVCLRWFKGK